MLVISSPVNVYVSGFLLPETNGTLKHQFIFRNEIRLENVISIRYLGTMGTNQNLIQEDITGKLNSGNACHHAVQNFLAYRLSSKNIYIKLYFRLWFCTGVTLCL
jgi:hypothetical protein